SRLAGFPIQDESVSFIYRWFSILGPLGQPAVQAPARQGIVKPVSSRRPIVELPEEQLATARTLEISCHIAREGKREHPGESGYKDHSSAAISRQMECLIKECQPGKE